MTRKKVLWVLTIFILVVIMLFLTDYPSANIKQSTFNKLNKIRQSKKQAVFDYFYAARNTAKSITNDNFMVRSFEILKESGKGDNGDLEFKIDEHYVSKYNKFYDILFVDSSGFVFHSIKKETDYHTNLISGSQSSSKLARALQKKTGGKFIEFEHYGPSDEPAAFFYVPVYKGNEHSGWFILQCALNRIKTILADRSELGRTGEVYLVNSQRLMLTDSRFIEDSTALKLRVDTAAVNEALKVNSGNRIIEDYRQVKVFSSYEKFNLFDVEWIIIAEIDESEVITEYFKKYKRHFLKDIIRDASELPRHKYPNKLHDSKLKRIDIDEFAKADIDTQLVTYAVASCTAIAIVVPDRFAYLVHISPTDEIYITNPVTKFFLKDKYHNLLGNLIERIKRYDVYAGELNKIKVTVIAPHSRSVDKIITTVLENDIELSNIKYIFNPGARNANVFLDHTGRNLDVEWVGDGVSYTEYAEEIVDLGSVMKKLINYDNESPGD